MTHYRFTDTMTFMIDPDNKTITIIRSYKHEDLVKAKQTVLAQYQGYKIVNESNEDRQD